MATGPGQPGGGIVQPRVSELISIPTVEPRATSSLVDAFRSGFVTADDIISRIDTRSRLKKKAEEQLYREQLSPEAVEAREAIQEAQKVEAKHKVRDAEIMAEEAPYGKRIRRLEAARKIAEGETFGTIDTIAKQFTLLGIEMPVRQDPETGLTVPDFSRVHEKNAEVQQYMRFMQSAKTRIDQLKDQEVQIGKAKGVGVLDPTGRLNMAEARKARNRLYGLTSLTFDQWQALGNPQDAEMFAGQPAPAPAAVPAPAPAAQFPSIFPAPQTLTPAPAAPAPAKAAGQVTPEGVILTTVPGEGGEAGTEIQARAQAAMGRFVTSSEIQDELTRRQFNPASLGTYIYEHLPEFFKSENVKLYQAAKSAWSQGVLRMESGAAISNREQAWYENSFFPQVMDSSTVQAAKASLRSDVEQTISRIATAGGVGGPEAKGVYDDIRRRAAQLSGWSGEKGTKNPESLGFEKVYRPDGSVLWKKDGQYFEPDIGSAPATAPAPSVTPTLVTPTLVTPTLVAPAVPVAPRAPRIPAPRFDPVTGITWPSPIIERK